MAGSFTLPAFMAAGAVVCIQKGPQRRPVHDASHEKNMRSSPDTATTTRGQHGKEHNEMKKENNTEAC